MIDISKNELSIKLHDSAHKNYLEPKTIPFCRPRRCDAFVYILGGSCIYVFEDGSRFEARAGSLLYLAEGAVYEMTVRERYDFICINFFFDCDAPRKSDIFATKDSVSTENLFFRAWKLQPSGSLPSRMSLVYQIYDDAISSRATSYLPHQNRAKIDEALTTISGNARDISVSDLAKNAKMSEVYFRKLFKSAVGVSPAKFIVDCKVSRAKEFLLEDYLTLDDISERCGFSSTSYFCRVFKDLTGLTPGEFRKSLDKP